MNLRKVLENQISELEQIYTYEASDAVAIAKTINELIKTILVFHIEASEEQDFKTRHDGSVEFKGVQGILDIPDENVEQIVDRVIEKLKEAPEEITIKLVEENMKKITQSIVEATKKLNKNSLCC